MKKQKVMYVLMMAKKPLDTDLHTPIFVFRDLKTAKETRDRYNRVFSAYEYYITPTQYDSRKTPATE